MWTLPDAAKRRRQSGDFAAGPFGSDFAPESSETIASSSPRESSANFTSTTDFFLFVTVCTSPDDYFECVTIDRFKSDLSFSHQTPRSDGPIAPV